MQIARPLLTSLENFTSRRSALTGGTTVMVFTPLITILPHLDSESNDGWFFSRFLRRYQMKLLRTLFFLIVLALAGMWILGVLGQSHPVAVPLTPYHPLVRINQLDPKQYASQQEYD